MKITVNGQSRRLDATSNLGSLLESIGVEAGRVVVELNGEILAQNVCAETTLKDGDHLEVIQFVGGG